MRILLTVVNGRIMDKETKELLDRQEELTSLISEAVGKGIEINHAQAFIAMLKSIDALRQLLIKTVMVVDELSKRVK